MTGAVGGADGADAAAGAGADRKDGAPGCRKPSRPSRILPVDATSSAVAWPSAAASRSPAGPGLTWPATGMDTERSNWWSLVLATLVWRFSPETTHKYRSLGLRRRK